MENLGIGPKTAAALFTGEHRPVRHPRFRRPYGVPPPGGHHEERHAAGLA
jgi:hypothetical protein